MATALPTQHQPFEGPQLQVLVPTVEAAPTALASPKVAYLERIAAIGAALVVRPLVFIGAAVIGSANAQTGDVPPRPGAAESTPGASSLEVEFWRSTEKIGTEAAYRAYMEAFPRGLFAPLAAAAISKLQTTTPATAAPAASSAVAQSAAQFKPLSLSLANIADVAASGAVNLKIGDELRGPGPVTVGWIGAKKQIIVPAGTWVVLAATDHNSSHPVPIRMTTLSLGRFDGSILKSHFYATFDSRPGSRWARWSDADACDAAGSTARFHWKEPGAISGKCVQIKLIADPLPMERWTGIFTPTQASLGRLGARPLDGPVVATDVYLTYMQGGYLKASIVDYIGNSGSASADADAQVARRSKWAVKYASVAAQGMARSVDAQELTPGQPSPRQMPQLED